MESKEAESATVRNWRTALAMFATLSASIALADDIETKDGKKYTDVTVSPDPPCGIKVTKKGMIVTLYFDELPKDVQERFHYDPNECNKYRIEQNNAVEQTKEELRKHEEENNKKKEKELKEREGEQWQKYVNDLQARYKSLWEQEGELEGRIAELEALPESLKQQLGRRWNYYPNPARKDLPLLESRLKEVRREKEEVRRKLDDTGQSY